MEGKTGGDTDSRVPFPWLKTTILLPERLQVFLACVHNLADASVRRRLVNTLPEYAGINPMQMSNDPPVTQGYREKAAWNRQVRVVQRLVVTLYLVIGQNKAVDVTEADFSPDELFKLLLTFLTAFLRDIGSSRKQAVD